MAQEVSSVSRRETPLVRLTEKPWCRQVETQNYDNAHECCNCIPDTMTHREQTQARTERHQSRGKERCSLVRPTSIHQSLVDMLAMGTGHRSVLQGASNESRRCIGNVDAQGSQHGNYRK